MPKKELLIKHSTLLIAYLLVVWGFYRFLFKLPEQAEELLIKPLLWLVPVFLLLRREKQGISSVGITTKNLFPSVYLSLALGVVFAIEGALVNFYKYKGVDFSANIGPNPIMISLGLSLATAISEEITFRGYLFNRVWQITGNELLSNISTSLVWGLIHLPITIFWWKLNFSATIGYLILTTIFGIGSAFLFARTKNVASSILLHILWSWPITLFR